MDDLESTVCLKIQCGSLFTQCFGTLYPIFPKRNNACLIMCTLPLYILKYVDFCRLFESSPRYFRQVLQVFSLLCRWGNCDRNAWLVQGHHGEVWSQNKRDKHWTSEQEVEFLILALLSLDVTLNKFSPYLFPHLVSSTSILLNFLGLLLE